MIVRQSLKALTDIDDIWFHIAVDDADAADGMVHRIVSATARLETFPLSAPERPEVGKGMRSLSVGPYVVLYRVLADHVLIVRVVHSARNLPRVLRDDA